MLYCVLKKKVFAGGRNELSPTIARLPRGGRIRGAISSKSNAPDANGDDNVENENVHFFEKQQRAEFVQELGTEEGEATYWRKKVAESDFTILTSMLCLYGEVKKYLLLKGLFAKFSHNGLF